MDENQNNNSIIVDQKPALFPLKEPKISNGETTPDGVELQKPATNEQTSTKFEGRPQTRQLREAGSSTLNTNVVMKDVDMKVPEESPQAKADDFKPANETKDDGDIPVKTRKEGKEGSSEGGESNNNSKNPTLDKTTSNDDGSTQLREGCLKNSTKANSQILQNSKSVEDPVDNAKSDCNLALGDASSGQSLASFTKEDEKSKRNRVKPNYSLEMAKASPVKKNSCDSHNEPVLTPVRRISKSKAEEICMKWIESLMEIETKTNMENDKDTSDGDRPIFCSNRICPISKDKIQKTSRALKQLKKVKMRKVHLENEYMEDDRWYCLKCLQAHQESLYCLYCCQIYFIEEEGLEDEEKIWICCDKCDRWIHLECDIDKGNNTKLREQDYRDESFKYKCPTCRPSSTKKATTKKEKKKVPKKSVKSKAERSKKVKADANMSSYSNSQDNDSQKEKNGVFQNDVNMVEEAPNNVVDMQQDSYVYNYEESKKETGDMSAKASSTGAKENRRSNRTRKMKESKSSRAKLTQKRKKLKRTHDEVSISNEELTRYRSLKMAKEREDIVEQRGMATRVLTFCGVTPSQVADRVDSDLDLIINKLYKDCQENEGLRQIFGEEFDESECYEGSPGKDAERGSYRANSSLKYSQSMGKGTANGENGGGKTLRPRRNRTATSKHH